MKTALLLSARPAVAFTAMGGLWGAYAAYVPVIKAQIGAGDWVFGSVLVAAAMGLMAAMFWAQAYDRLMGRFGLPLGMVMLAGAFLFPGVMHSPLTFAAAMIVVASASGTVDIAMNARVSEIEAAKGRSLMNFAHGMFSVGYAAGAITAGLAREAGLPPLWCFAALFVVIAVAAPFSAIAPDDSTEPGTAKPASLPLPLLFAGGGIILLAFMTEGATEAWSALHIERGLGGGAAEGAMGPATLGVTMAIGRFGGQAIAGWLGEARLLKIFSCLAALGAWLAAAAGSPGVAYIGFGILGLGVSAIAPTALALVGRRAAKGTRTQTIARISVIGFSGFFFGPPLMGGLSEVFGLATAFAVLGFAILGVLPLLLVLRR
ncbi:MFS transporter [Alphaproteobacteria bacterium KMM 3653]|uniref:MFS transporter n=1 Tax=Harenicola maris TaxID=2841044 RepID=A0AAP2G8Q4_9RHOB|nr:MFS transporter [Harenicola maris]